MAVRTTELGGTDWSDGEVLTASDLNDTIEALAFGKISLASGNSLLSTTSTTYVDMDSTNGKITFTLSETKDVIIFISCPMAVSSGYTGYVAIDVDGTQYQEYVLSETFTFVTLFHKMQLSSGTHTASIVWKVQSGGTIRNWYGSNDHPRYQIMVIELPQIQS